MTKKWMISGGCGFVGSHLTKALVARGDQVRVLDDVSRGHPEALKDVSCEVFLGDVCHPRFVREALKGCDAVVHLASINGTRNFYERPGRVLEVCARGILNVMDACIEEGVTELHAASSSEVYHYPPKLPTHEDVPLVIPDVHNPRYSYACGKQFTEMMALHYHPEHFRRVTVFRPHNVYGPNGGEDHVIPQFIRRIQGGLSKADPQLLPVQGNTCDTRAFCYVDDAVAGILAILDRGGHRQVYHVGTGHQIPIWRLVEILGAVMGVPGLRAARVGQGQSGGTPMRCPDCSKLKALGWEPKVGLAEGLKQTADWYKEHPVT